MLAAGNNLRTLREQLGLTMRDVEYASMQIAQHRKNEEYIVAPSRLSDIETKGILPSIYRVYSLAAIYRRDPREILSWYGIDLNSAAEDLTHIVPPKSHLSTALASAYAAEIPVRLDPGFDSRKTANLGRIVEQWGLVPLTYLAKLANQSYSYGYIGSEDFTMFPILPPGSFIQVDESKNQVIENTWRSEYERPVYFVETRDGHTCCWCAMRRENLILQPHPLSPVSVRVLRHPQEAEIIGQVVGVAMKLGEWVAFEPLPAPKAPSALN